MSLQRPPVAAFSALGDNTRCRLILRLAYGPATAGQLAELSAVSRPAISQHVKVLRDAGLVRGSRQGKFICYELDGEALIEAEHWLSTLVNTWSAAPTRRTDHNPSRSPRTKERQ